MGHQCKDPKIMCRYCGELICCLSYDCDLEGKLDYDTDFYPDTCIPCFLKLCDADYENDRKRDQEKRIYYSRYKKIPLVGNIIYHLLVYCKTTTIDD
jgi:hypothetical protein